MWFQHTATRRWLPWAVGNPFATHEFQHTATRRWLQPKPISIGTAALFQHTATRRWLPRTSALFGNAIGFQHTATRRWLRQGTGRADAVFEVSTHSHPKVAAPPKFRADRLAEVSTHSHPKVAAVPVPEFALKTMFQHTATRRWLPDRSQIHAGYNGFNTQPPEGGCAGHFSTRADAMVSTHSHPKVAAAVHDASPLQRWFQHTATRRWLR